MSHKYDPGITTPGLSEPGSNGNGGVQPPPELQNWSITIRGSLVSYSGPHFFSGGLTPLRVIAYSKSCRLGGQDVESSNTVCNHEDHLPNTVIKPFKPQMYDTVTKCNLQMLNLNYWNVYIVATDKLSWLSMSVR